VSGSLNELQVELRRGQREAHLGRPRRWAGRFRREIFKPCCDGDAASAHPAPVVRPPSVTTKRSHLDAVTLNAPPREMGALIQQILDRLFPRVCE
jgi:hypothetical protein